MNLDVTEPVGRKLELRRLQKRRRHAEAEPLLERVIGAAGQDDDTRAHGFAVREGHVDTVARGVDADRAAASNDGRTGQDGAIGHRAIERGAIDDHGLGGGGRVIERVSGRGDESHGRQGVEHRSAGKIQ
jgi:hypothetical protein